MPVATLPHQPTLEGVKAVQADAAVESDPRSWEELQRIEGFPDAEIQRRMINECLALTSQVLIRRNFRDTAEVMERIVRYETELQGDYNGEFVCLWLEYEPEDAELFEKGEHPKRIRDAFNEITGRRRYDPDLLNHCAFREVLPIVTGGWREQLAEILHGKRRSNHARRVREEDPRWTEDQLFFTNSGELQVYRELKKWQENKFPAHETISIFPLAKG